MSEDEDEDDWYRRREDEWRARQEWLDSGAARREAAWLFIWIVAIFIAVAVFALGMWLVYNVIFVPGAPEELLPQRP